LLHEVLAARAAADDPRRVHRKAVRVTRAALLKLLPATVPDREHEPLRWPSRRQSMFQLFRAPMVPAGYPELLSGMLPLTHGHGFGDIQGPGRYLPPCDCLQAFCVGACDRAFLFSTGFRPGDPKVSFTPPDGLLDDHLLDSFRYLMGVTG
jgi:hypothetical protein